jgi:hypothetical protein
MASGSCPTCGQPAAEAARFCSRCGAAIPAGRRWRRSLAIGGAVVAVLAVFAYEYGTTPGDYTYTGHGLTYRYPRVEFLPDQTMSASEASARGADWGVWLTPFEGTTGSIAMYGTREPSHEQASALVQQQVADFQGVAHDEDATRIHGPRLVRLPADGAALTGSWQSAATSKDEGGPGRYYAIAVGDQMVRVVCLGDPGESNAGMNETCDRIVHTLAPAH